MSVLLFLGAILTAMLGSFMLALSQKRHWHALMGSRSRSGRALRRLGWALIATSFPLIVLYDGASFAALFWPMLIGFAALLTAVTLTWAPEIWKPMARCGEDHRP